MVCLHIYLVFSLVRLNNPTITLLRGSSHECRKRKKKRDGRSNCIVSASAAEFYVSAWKGGRQKKRERNACSMRRTRVFHGFQEEMQHHVCVCTCVRHLHGGTHDTRQAISRSTFVAEREELDNVLLNSRMQQRKVALNELIIEITQDRITEIWDPFIPKDPDITSISRQLGGPTILIALHFDLFRRTIMIKRDYGIAKWVRFIYVICKWSIILELSTLQVSKNAKFCEEREIKARSPNREFESNIYPRYVEKIKKKIGGEKASYGKFIWNVSIKIHRFRQSV